MSTTEKEFHELTYMQRSLELANVKEEIEKLVRDRHFIDKKIEEKTHLENDLTKKCVRHLQVLRRKGITPDSYCPKKRGVTATPVKSPSPYTTPTKMYTGGHAPNYFPSPRSYMTGAERAAYNNSFVYNNNSPSTTPRGGLGNSYSVTGPSPRKQVLSPRTVGLGSLNQGSRFPSSIIPQQQARAYGIPGSHTQQPSYGIIGQQLQHFPAQLEKNPASPCGTYAMSPHGASVAIQNNMQQPLQISGNFGEGVTTNNVKASLATKDVEVQGGKFGETPGGSADDWDSNDQITETEILNYVHEGGDNGVGQGDGAVHRDSGNIKSDPAICEGTDEYSKETGCSTNGPEDNSGKESEVDAVEKAARNLFG